MRVAGCDADEFGVDLVAGGAFEREHEGVVRVRGEEGGDGEELRFQLKGEFLQEGGETERSIEGKVRMADRLRGEDVPAS